MSRLSYGFILGYHGCDLSDGEAALEGRPFQPSTNDYDWLGEGVYFWEANPLRGLEFAKESMKRKGSRIKLPFVVGTVIDLGACLDLTTSLGIATVARAYESLKASHRESDTPLPENTPNGLRRYLDCAVINRVHAIFAEQGLPAFDTVRGIFTEGGPAFAGAGIQTKTHVQIAVRNTECIKGVFRVPEQHLTLAWPQAPAERPEDGTA